MHQQLEKHSWGQRIATCTCIYCLLVHTPDTSIYKYEICNKELTRVVFSFLYCIFFPIIMILFEFCMQILVQVSTLCMNNSGAKFFWAIGLPFLNHGLWSELYLCAGVDCVLVIFVLCVTGLDPVFPKVVNLNQVLTLC